MDNFLIPEKKKIIILYRTFNVIQLLGCKSSYHLSLCLSPMYIKVICFCFYLSNFDSDANYLWVLHGLHAGQRGDAGMNDDHLLR